MALPGSTDNVRFEAAALGDDSGIIGCAAFARSQTRGGVPTVLTFDRHVPPSNLHLVVRNRLHES